MAEVDIEVARGIRRGADGGRYTDHAAGVKVVGKLVAERYSRKEITRAMKATADRGLILFADSRLTVSKEFLPAVRSHLLLDLIATEGSVFQTLIGIAGVALVPGYGQYHWLTVVDLDAVVRASYGVIWPEGYMADLQLLCTAGLVVLR